MAPNECLKSRMNTIYAGLGFWKVGSRKLFAVKWRGKKRKRRATVPEDSEDDDMPLNCEVLTSLSVLNQNVNKILEVSRRLNLPIGFLSLLSETFLCKICQSNIVPPAIFARCCKTIIGCQRCVDRWYRGEAGLEKKCPLCRGDRGFADTCRVVGMDDFLQAVDSILRFVPPPPASPPSIPSD